MRRTDAKLRYDRDKKRLSEGYCFVCEAPTKFKQYDKGYYKWCCEEHRQIYKSWSLFDQRYREYELAYKYNDVLLISELADYFKTDISYCGTCKNVFEVLPSRTQYCSNNCSLAEGSFLRACDEWWSNPDNSEKIAQINQNSGDRLREKWTDPEFRAKYTIRNRNNALANWKLESYREIMADKLTSFGTRGWHQSPKSGLQYYASSYELGAFQLLDKLDKVKSYLANKRTVEYIYQGDSHTYLIDLEILYTDGSTQWVEIKPRDLIDQPKNIYKWTSAKKKAKELGYTFEVWTESRIWN